MSSQEQAIVQQYSGPLVDGRPHGTGLIQYSNGIQFQGQFIAGKKHGNGVMLFPSGPGQQDTITLTAEWEEGQLKNGVGRLNFPDQDVYEGALREDGVMEGDGVYYFHNGDIYSGRWVAGKRNGLGRMQFFSANKDKKATHPEEEYTGEWKDARPR
jgi:hypothetical protein